MYSLSCWAFVAPTTVYSVWNCIATMNKLNFIGTGVSDHFFFNLCPPVVAALKKQLQHPGVFLPN